MKRRLLYWVGALTCVAAAYGIWTALRPRDCSCVDYEGTVRAFERLGSMGWATLDRAQVQEIWPDASEIPCRGWEGGGVEAIADHIERCRDDCGTCGGPLFASTPTPLEPARGSGLRHLSLVLCRRSEEKALEDARRLADALGPEEPIHVDQDGWSPSPRRTYTRNELWWHSQGETLHLEINAYWAGEGIWSVLWRRDWTAVIDVERRIVGSPIEEWPLGGGGVARVLRSRTEDDDGQRVLFFTYASDCLRDTQECLDGELRELWPPLREHAEAQEATTIFLIHDTGFAFGVHRGGRSLEKSSDHEGGWDGLPDTRPRAETAAPSTDAHPSDES